MPLGVCNRVAGTMIFACAALCLAQDAPKSPAGPEVVTVFPLGARRGTPVEVDLRGKSLAGAYAVWFSGTQLTVKVGAVAPFSLPVNADEKEKKDAPTEHVPIRIDIPESSEPGVRTLRLVTPHGVSNAIAFNVVTERTMAESEKPHGLPEFAQVVKAPIIIDGAIGGDSQSDYYAFDVTAGQELAMEVLRASPPPNVLNPTGRGDVALTLYDASGSWFDAHRPQRLDTNFAPIFMGATTEPRIVHHFEKAGRYLLEVAGNRVFYEVRIGPVTANRPWVEAKESGWAERSFVRQLKPERIDALWTRSVRATPTGMIAVQSGTGTERVTAAESLPVSLEAGVPGAPPPIVEETQPNDLLAQAKTVPIPGILEGAIEHPGDRDNYRFTVKPGERLAFEIETPKTKPPEFNPLLTIYDHDGKQVLTNVYKRIGRNDTFYVKTPEPKTVYTFEREGDYTLEIRDATSRWGDPGFRYRVLLRPQVPHLGDVQVDQERLNLARGEARKLNVTTAQEEDFSGEIAVTIEGLPVGVDVLPATEVKPEKGPPLDEGHKNWFRPKTETASLLLVARGDAPLTEMPKFIRVVCRPVVRGVVGTPVVVKELPMMVVQ